MNKCVVLCLLVMALYAARANADNWTLTAGSKDRYSGELLPSDSTATIRLSSPAFALPIGFDPRYLSSIQRTDAGKSTRATGEFGVDLANGDTLFGDLRRWDQEAIELATQSFGVVRVRREQVDNVYRWNHGEALVYAGPTGLEDWQITGNSDSCLMERGHLVLEQPNTTVTGKMDLPEQCRIDLELSWSSKPRFYVLIGANDTEESHKTAIRIEVWDREVVLLCERDDRADMMVVAPAVFGGLNLVLLIDRFAGRTMVCQANGETLGSIDVGKTVDTDGKRLVLINRGGPLRLKNLRVIHGAAVPTANAPSTQPRVVKTDKTSIDGTVESFNMESRSLYLKTVNGSVELKLDEVARIEQNRQPIPAAEIQAEPAQSPTFTASTVDGLKVHGHLVRIDQRALALRSPPWLEDTVLPLDRLVSLVNDSPEKPTDWKGSGRVGTLKLQNTLSDGVLIGAPDDSPHSCLVWRAFTMLDANPLARDVSGMIEYRDPTRDFAASPIQEKIRQENAKVQALARQRAVPQGLLGATLSAIIGTSDDRRKRALYLRDGDVVPCYVKRIDEQGVTFESTASKATFVPHSEVKAVELTSGREPSLLTPKKRERLLTLPRMQRKRPPKNLVVTNAGDYLRGELVSLSEAELVIEVRQELITVPRLGLSHIIWFHPEELPDYMAAAETDANESKTETTEQPLEGNAPDKAPAVEGTLAQAICRTGVRLTFRPTQSSANALMGPSEVLGLCHVSIEDIDQLLLGDEIATQVQHEEYANWRLAYAPDPNVLSESNADAADSSMPGMTSPLVGKPAPEFTLPTLDGERFRLADHRGEVIVLDFFATWCGPCVAAMPEIDSVVTEFKDSPVKLVAVNLQESSTVIIGLLDRLKVNPLVVRDEIGTVAAAYQANAIPQTVVIDENGIVTHLFIGGGSKLPDQLREAILKALNK